MDGPRVVMRELAVLALPHGSNGNKILGGRVVGHTPTSAWGNHNPE